MRKTLKRIYRLPHSIRVGFMLAEVVDLTANLEFDKALCKVNKIHNVGQLNRIKVDILRGFLVGELEEYGESIIIFRNVLKNIKKSDKYNNYDKNYLKSHISWIANDNIRKLDGISNHLHEFRDLNLGNVNLNNVSRRLKQDFPLRCHPQWSD